MALLRELNNLENSSVMFVTTTLTLKPKTSVPLRVKLGLEKNILASGSPSENIN